MAQDHRDGAGASVEVRGDVDLLALRPDHGRHRRTPSSSLFAYRAVSADMNVSRPAIWIGVRSSSVVVGSASGALGAATADRAGRDGGSGSGSPSPPPSSSPP